MDTLNENGWAGAPLRKRKNFIHDTPWRKFDRPEPPVSFLSPHLFILGFLFSAYSSAPRHSSSHCWKTPTKESRLGPQGLLVRSLLHIRRLSGAAESLRRSSRLRTLRRSCATDSGFAAC